MRVMITGSNSLLGKSIWDLTPQHSAILLTHSLSHRPKFSRQSCAPLDVRDEPSVARLMRHFRPDWMLHLAAISDVEACESSPDLAEEVNVHGTKNVLKYAQKYGSGILYISTNGVFDGKAPPYGESRKPHPLHVYGKTKYAAEQLIKNALVPWMIVRLMTLYGWQPEGTRINPVTWAIEKLQRNESLNMVNDCFVNPLFAPSAADAVWKLLTGSARGIYHVAGKSKVSRYAWTRTIARVFGFDPSLVRPVPSSFFPSVTPRPHDTTLVTRKLERSVDWKPLSLTKGLTQMLKNRKTEGERLKQHA